MVGPAVNDDGLADVQVLQGDVLVLHQFLCHPHASPTAAGRQHLLGQPSLGSEGHGHFVPPQEGPAQVPAVRHLGLDDQDGAVAHEVVDLHFAHVIRLRALLGRGLDDVCVEPAHFVVEGQLHLGLKLLMGPLLVDLLQPLGMGACGLTVLADLGELDRWYVEGDLCAAMVLAPQDFLSKLMCEVVGLRGARGRALSYVLQGLHNATRGCVHRAV
mmetsp:Transcript_11968/g.21740  ORF Transcript_11968/g.21740 Transcript_11968/m.21740 type:complete len:215 (-) Transcript_11968:33-677(-)